MSDTNGASALADRLNKLIERLPHDVEEVECEPGPPDEVREERKKSGHVGTDLLRRWRALGWRGRRSWIWATALVASVGFGALAGWIYAGFPGHERKPARGALLVAALVVTIAVSPGPHASAHPSVSVDLSATPKIVRNGARTELTAHLSPCEGHEGSMVDFYWGTRKIATAPGDEFCVATVGIRLRKTVLFKAALLEGGHLAGMSTPVKVRVS